MIYQRKRIDVALRLITLGWWIVLVCVPLDSSAQQTEAEGQTIEGTIDFSDWEPSRIPAPVKVYMGRRVAETMHYLGAEWLIRNEREREERCSLMLTNLGLKPGQVVCDMGCGNGYHSLPIAKIMGSRGTVLAVDVQPEMLVMLRQRMEEEGVDNIIPILGSLHHPRLPVGMIDILLMVDVYHEFSHPEEMLTEIRKSLKPDGLVVLVEYRAEDRNVPIRPLHKMSKQQIDREMTANGFKLVKEFERLPWQHMVFYGIDNGETETDNTTDTETDREAEMRAENKIESVTEKREASRQQ